VADHDKLLDQLSVEYKILQDKIDKIGAFKFTVRGWSVTLVIGAIFAVGSTKLVSPLLLLLLCAFVWLFFFVEWKQSNYQSLFGDRAFQIEKEIRRLIRAHSESLPRDVGFSPRIAHDLSDAARRSSPKGRFAGLRRWAKDPDHLFYVAQTAALLIAIFVFRHTRMENREGQPPTPAMVFEYRKEESNAAHKPASKSVEENGKRKTKKTTNQ